MPLDVLRSEEHTSELQSLRHLVCRLLLEKKKIDFRRFRMDKTDISLEPPSIASFVGAWIDEELMQLRIEAVRVAVLVHVPFFFFNDTATTEIYTLSLHDALPISAFASDEGSPGLAGVLIAIWSAGSA